MNCEYYCDPAARPVFSLVVQFFIDSRLHGNEKND